MLRTFVIFLFSAGPGLAMGVQSDWERVRSMAESQHEIIMLLIKNGQFDRVVEASRKLFSLNFPREQEHLLVDEARILSDSLMHHQEFSVAQQVLDEAYKAVYTNRAKAAICKEKAYLFSKQGRDEEAMKWFERAIELEKSQP